MESNFNNYNSFYSLCSVGKHKELAKEVYDRLPKNVKKKIETNRVMICDYFFHSRYPDKRINGMPFGFFNSTSKLIDLIPEETKRLSEEGLKGVIAHEVAHFYIESLFLPLRKLKRFIFLHKFKKLPVEYQKFYRESEELYADTIAISWGFEKEISIMNQERQIKPC
ncbi:MAG: hypothetical protein Q7R52_03575 [archaeon]|nr:hypothetical protein [archaeon]